MSDRDARDFHRRWATIAAPLRPPPQVAQAMGTLVEGRDGLTLQLGVTPEIARLTRRSLALDWDEQMVRIAWHAAAGHGASVADWRALPLADASVRTVTGDGSLNVLQGNATALWRELGRVLVPGARIVLRCFVAPEPAESLGAVQADALAGTGGSFAAFKLRFNMAAFAAGGGGAVTSHTLFEHFAVAFPDRALLARRAGWSAATIAQIDAYANGASLHAYPCRRALLAALPWPGRFVETAGYELAERCPLLVIDLPG